MTPDERQFYAARSLRAARAIAVSRSAQSTLRAELLALSASAFVLAILTLLLHRLV